MRIHPAISFGIASVAFALASYNLGTARESARVEATCIDPEAHTILNGHEYVCMTIERATTDLKEVFRRGVEAGRALARKEVSL